MTDFTTYSLRLLCCRVAMHAALFDKEMNISMIIMLELSQGQILGTMKTRITCI